MLRIWPVRNESKMIVERKAGVSVRNLDVLSCARMERVKQSVCRLRLCDEGLAAFNCARMERV